MNRLKYLLSLAPKLTDIFERHDIMVAITDIHQYIYYSRSLTQDAGVHIGQPFLTYDLFGDISRTKSHSQQIAPADYGPPFMAVGSPVFDERGVFVGGIGFGIPTQYTKSFIETIQTFSKNFTQHGLILGSEENLEKSLLNAFCSACGKYGMPTCATCPTEILRQEKVMYEMKSIFLLAR